MVFWEYESLFNKIDSIKSTFTRPEYRAKEWIQELHAGIESYQKNYRNITLELNMHLFIPMHAS
jgi:hypothetical protein